METLTTLMTAIIFLPKYMKIDVALKLLTRPFIFSVRIYRYVCFMYISFNAIIAKLENSIIITPFKN